jgi:hypothetical protein
MVGGEIGLSRSIVNLHLSFVFATEHSGSFLISAGNSCCPLAEGMHKSGATARMQRNAHNPTLEDIATSWGWTRIPFEHHRIYCVYLLLLLPTTSYDVVLINIQHDRIGYFGEELPRRGHPDKRVT